MASMVGRIADWLHDRFCGCGLLADECPDEWAEECPVCGHERPCEWDKYRAGDWRKHVG